MQAIRRRTRLPIFVLMWAACVPLASAQEKAAGRSAEDEGFEEQIVTDTRRALHKYLEMVEAWDAYRTRKDLSEGITAMERMRDDQDRWVENLHVHVGNMDGNRRWRTNAEQAVYEEWLIQRDNLSVINRRLDDMHSRLKELDDQAFRKAEFNRGAVGPRDRDGLLAEAQRRERACLDAFEGLQATTDEKMKETGEKLDPTLRKAAARVGGFPKEVLRQFVSDFEKYVADKDAMAKLWAEPPPPKKGSKPSRTKTSR